MTEILIKNGTVIDPANKIHEKLDVAISGTEIEAIGNLGSMEARFVINAENCLVTPGLFDHHAHLSPMAFNGVPGEAVCFPAGVTGVGEAGSAGCNTYENSRILMQSTRLTVKCWLNVCNSGLSSLPVSENVDPKGFNRDRIKELFSRYPHELLGLKLRTSKNVVGELGYGPLRETVRLAEELRVPVMVHCTDPPGKIDELVGLLRPGDIMTHMYQGTGHTILNEAGHVSQEVWRARKRGVLFEAADARVHFSLPVAQAAIADGFWPDFISTDYTSASMFQKPVAFSMGMQLNRYIDLGIPQDEVIRLCTVNPAKSLNVFPGQGSLSVGTQADIAVLQQVEVPAEFSDRPIYDPAHRSWLGKIRLKPVLTIKNGEFVFRDLLF